MVEHYQGRIYEQLLKLPLTQQTRDPVLNQCWASVIDGGQKLNPGLVFVGKRHVFIVHTALGSDV